MNRRLLVVSSIFAAGLVAACDEKTSDLSDTVRPNAYGFQMVGQATNLPRGTARFRLPNGAQPESIVVTLRGLDSLGTGFWTAWVGDSLGTTFVRITGDLSVVRQDTTLNPLGQADTTVNNFSFPAVSAISNGGTNQVMTWRFSRATSGVAATDSMQTFLITMEDNNAATTPGSRRFLWARRIEGGTGTAPGTNKNAALKFGNFGSTTLTEYLYSAAPARGRGYFQRQIFSVNDSTLARPPLGFYYGIYMHAQLYLPGDTLFVGPLRSPWPRRELSLQNADSLITDPEVVLSVPPSILAAALRISGDTLGMPTSFPYAGYAFVRLNLVPKAGVAGQMGGMRILQAPVPFGIWSGGLQ
ncbi:MAG TPA: hypothetical protein VJR92_12190 [Gemmatimonadaceae bacterium]|nr:hypothetical protein [Gemmatimonadaceae bacterium]